MTPVSRDAEVGKVLPLDAAAVVVPPDVLLLLPHADAMSARPTATEVAVTIHFHVCLPAVTSWVSEFRLRSCRRWPAFRTAAFLLTLRSQG
jgi:hypothetical protein